jgi:hypothetical protein
MEDCLVGMMINTAQSATAGFWTRNLVTRHVTRGMRVMHPLIQLPAGSSITSKSCSLLHPAHTSAQKREAARAGHLC